MNEILIYDDIGVDWYGNGVTAKGIKKQLDEISGGITVRINSPGGDVFEGVAIYNLLRERGVDVVVDGLAASAASVIAMAGTEVSMGAGAMLMIHNPWTMAVGDAQEMEKTAAMLKEVGESLINIYMKRVALTKPDLQQMMDEETWITAEAARSLGFATDVTEDEAQVVNLSRPWIRNGVPEHSFPFRVAARKRRLDLINRISGSRRDIYSHEAAAERLKAQAK